MSLPLSGVRIVSVEQYGAGPFGTQHLADLGAEVIKIENFHDGGDIGRAVGPQFFGPGDSHFYEAFNRNKRSLGLDLKHPKGQEIFRKLVDRSDAVFDNLRGDLPTKLGITYAQLANVNPKIVCVHLSAYGRSGSRASWPGYDYLMQAESGLMNLTGEPEGPPSRIGAPSMVDQTAGLIAAFGLLAAVIQARSTGKGCDVDTCLLDVAVHQLGYAATWYLNNGLRLSREHRSAHYSLAPVQTYPTADGWIFIMCMTDKFWLELADAVGRGDLKSDTRFNTTALRHSNREQLTEILDGELRKQPTRYWLDKLNGIVPVAPVLDIAQSLGNPYLAETQMISKVPHPAKPDLRALANPIKINGERLKQSVCPPLGTDNHAFVGQPSRQ